MPDLGDYGAGVPPEKRDDTRAHDSRSERAKHRRMQYRLGRCRGVAKSKGCRCGAGIIKDSEGPFCHYHGLQVESPYDGEPVTIDDDPALLARWCGQRPTTEDEIPWRVLAALEVLADAE